MKNIYFLLFFFPFSIFAQTTHNVEVGGSTAGGPLPYYSPQELTINSGDEVIWTSVSGTHNVNGTWMHFPDNPEEFLSGEPEPQMVFSHTFTIPGVYSYHCDQEGHSMTQFGSITVMDANTVPEDPTPSGITLFPSPANEVLIIEIGDLSIQRAEILSIDGRTLADVSATNASRLEMNISSFTSGQYYLRLTDANGRQIGRMFRKL